MTGKLLDLPIDLIDDGTNVRTKIDTGLRRSILDVGVLQPITVSPLEDDRFRCLYGHRRLAAARVAGLKTIPAIVEPMPPELPLRQLMENANRRSVNPLDVARTLRAWLDEDPSRKQRELAERLGRSGYWVSTRLALLEMDEALQQRVGAGEMRVDQALAAHKATTEQPPGRGRPRVLQPGRASGSASVVVELDNPSGRSPGQATIELDRARGRVKLLLEDGDGYGIAVTLTPAAADLLGRRLRQAFQAVEVAA